MRLAHQILDSFPSFTLTRSLSLSLSLQSSSSSRFQMEKKIFPKVSPPPFLVGWFVCLFVRSFVNCFFLLLIWYDWLVITFPLFQFRPKNQSIQYHVMSSLTHSLIPDWGQELNNRRTKNVSACQVLEEKQNLLAISQKPKNVIRGHTHSFNQTRRSG